MADLFNTALFAFIEVLFSTSRYCKKNVGMLQ